MRRYILIIILAPLLLSSAFAQNSRKAPRSIVHIVSCDDTDDSMIGEPCRKANTYYTHTLIDSINLCTGNTAVCHSFTGNSFTKEEIFNRLDYMKTEPEDVILFHYSGNGFSVKNDSLPILSFHKDTTQLSSDSALYLSDIYTLLRSKPHRLMIIVYDGSRIVNDSVATDSIQRIEFPSNVDRTRYKNKVKHDNTQNSWDSLFSQSTGNYIIFACRYGESCFIFPGIGSILDYYLQTVFSEIYYGSNKTWVSILSDICKRACRVTHDSDIDQHPCWSEIKPTIKEAQGNQ